MQIHPDGEAKELMTLHGPLPTFVSTAIGLIRCATAIYLRVHTRNDRSHARPKIRLCVVAGRRARIQIQVTVAIYGTAAGRGAVSRRLDTHFHRFSSAVYVILFEPVDVLFDQARSWISTVIVEVSILCMCVYICDG